MEDKVSLLQLGRISKGFLLVIVKGEQRPSKCSRFKRNSSSRIDRLERFSQLGFEDANECPRLCKLAYEYLKKSKGCEESIYEYFAKKQIQSRCMLN